MTTGDIAQRRMGALALFTFCLFAALVARLWFLQVMQAPEFAETAAANRTREIFTEAPRGQIYDAKGRLLAGRRESLVVVLDWTELREFDEEARFDIYREVADELNGQGIKMKVEALETRFQAARNGSLKPVVVADDVGEQVWVAMAERDLAGFHVERRWIRVYPYGSIGSHIIGYTGTVANQDRANELNAANRTKIYFPGDELGLAGIERLFENSLRGLPEIRKVEIDANNRVIGTVEVLQHAIPGQDIHLSIDIDLQYSAEQILIDELRLARRREACKGCSPHVAEAGSLVALDVNDGSVVALASVPTFDPSDFVFGIGAEQFAYLRDRPDQPFLDRSTRGLYAPGSTFKPVTAYAALESGARSEWELWNDQGRYTIENCTSSTSGAGCVFRNAGEVVLGEVDLRTSLEVSSDTYYYSLGERFWVEQALYGETVIQDTAELFGFGKPTGVQLPVEEDGRVPTPENRRAEFGEDRGWFTGDNVNLSIGQGDLLVTPLQLANSYAMLATGGVRYQPRLIDRVSGGAPGAEDQEFLPRVDNDLPLNPAYLAPIRDGLLRVARTGTATQAFAGFDLDRYPIVGKTGTSQVNNRADFSLFAAFGPWPNPQYSVAAVLEEAGFGGDAAAPAVRRFFDLLAGNQPIPTAPLAGEDGVPPARPTAIGGNQSAGSVGGEIGRPTTEPADTEAPDTEPAPDVVNPPVVPATTTTSVAPPASDPPDPEEGSGGTATETTTSSVDGPPATNPPVTNAPVTNAPSANQLPTSNALAAPADQEREP